MERALHDRRLDDPTFLKRHGEKTQARAVPGQNLHVVAALAAEYECRSRIGIGAQRLRHIGGQPVEAAPHVDGLTSQIDLHARCELEHQATPSANRTRRSASASTSASSDTLAPFGRLISIAPRLSPRRVGRAGFAATSERGGAEAASNSSSFTGKKTNPPLSGGATTTGFSFAGSRRRSRQPSRERRIHLKTRLAFSPCRRATAATEAPGARASSTILLRSSRLLVRRRSPAPSRAAI